MNYMQVKLAEALLRRKELAAKVSQIAQVKTSNLFEVKASRKAAHEGIDDIIVSVPKVSLSQVTAEFDFYSKQLRLCDAIIQQLNWTTQVPDAEKFMEDWDVTKVIPNPK
jgi:hypothetical protein